MSLVLNISQLKERILSEVQNIGKLTSDWLLPCVLQWIPFFPFFIKVQLLFPCTFISPSCVFSTTSFSFPNKEIQAQFSFINNSYYLLSFVPPHMHFLPNLAFPLPLPLLSLELIIQTFPSLDCKMSQNHSFCHLMQSWFNLSADMWALTFSFCVLTGLNLPKTEKIPMC